MHVWHSYQCGSRHSTIGGNRRSAKSGKLCLVCGWHHGTDMGNAPKIYIIGCLQIPSYYTWVANWIAIGNLLYTNDTNDKSCSQFFFNHGRLFHVFLPDDLALWECMQSFSSGVRYAKSLWIATELCFKIPLGKGAKKKLKKKLTNVSFMYVCVAGNGEMLGFFPFFPPNNSLIDN